MKKPVFLLLGTNLGDRTANLLQAIQEIDRLAGKIVKASSIYETSAWGKTDQPAFLNQAVEISTRLEAEELLTQILSIEEQLGRQRRERWGERIIDVDILFFGNEIYTSPRLVVPHPQLGNRRFSLVPLHEIAPDLVHPLLKKTVRELLETCPDILSVEKFSDAPPL